MFFVHQWEKLEQIASSLELDCFVLDELLAIDPEEHLFVSTSKITCAVLTDEQAAIYYSILEVAESTELITDALALVVVDELLILLFNAEVATFCFVKTNDVEQANNLLETLV